MMMLNGTTPLTATSVFAVLEIVGLNPVKLEVAEDEPFEDDEDDEDDEW